MRLAGWVSARRLLLSRAIYSREAYLVRLSTCGPFSIDIRQRHCEKSFSSSLVFGMGLDTNEGAQPLIGSLTFRVVIAGKVESNIRDRF